MNHSSAAAVSKNGYSNYPSSYLAENRDSSYDSSNWKENYDYVKYPNKMQVDGIKSVQFERQTRNNVYQPQQQQQIDPETESYYRNSYYRAQNRRYRARSESESYEIYDPDYYQLDNLRSDLNLKRTRDAISPPMEPNKSKYADYKDSSNSSLQSIPFTRSINNKSLNSSPRHHSVLVNNHINNYNRFSPKLKPRSPLNSYRNKIRALTPLSKQKAMLMRGNFRHKSLSPTLLKSGSTTTVSRGSSGNTPADSDDQDAESRTLDDEDCENEEDDEPEPPFPTGDSTLDEEDLTDPEDNYQTSLSISSSEKSLITLNTQPSAVNTNCCLGGYIETAPLAPSLFPYVPPYITFAPYNEKGPEIPPVIQKHLKWKLTTITPILVRKVLFNTGFRLIKSEY